MDLTALVSLSLMHQSETIPLATFMMILNTFNSSVLQMDKQTSTLTKSCMTSITFRSTPKSILGHRKKSLSSSLTLGRRGSGLEILHAEDAQLILSSIMMLHRPLNNFLEEHLFSTMVEELFSDLTPKTQSV